jgi:steroid delta-isomerase-like uncharacterized protein
VPIAVSDKNKAVVLRFVEEVANGRNLDAIDELLSEDFALPPDGSGALSRDGLKGVLTYYFAAFPDLHYTVEEVVAEGDNVVLRVKMRGTQDGEYGGQAPSGRDVEVDEVDLFVVREGLIRGYRIVWDELGFRRQLGLPLE